MKNPKLPRSPIRSVFVALAALNFGAIRALSDIKSTSRNVLRQGLYDPAEFDRIMNTLTRVDLLGSGALPMGNILAFGFMIHRRRRNRPFVRDAQGIRSPYTAR